MAADKKPAGRRNNPDYRLTRVPSRNGGTVRRWIRTVFVGTGPTRAEREAIAREAEESHRRQLAAQERARLARLHRRSSMQDNLGAEVTEITVTRDGRVVYPTRDGRVPADFWIERGMTESADAIPFAVDCPEVVRAALTRLNVAERQFVPLEAEHAAISQHEEELLRRIVLEHGTDPSDPRLPEDLRDAYALAVDTRVRIEVQMNTLAMGSGFPNWRTRRATILAGQTILARHGRGPRDSIRL